MTDEGEHLTTIEGEILESHVAGGKLRAHVEYDVPQILVDAFGWGALDECLREGKVEWTIRVVGDDG